ncbi:MAG: methylenetetrahydrofolate reductase [Clostridia bacterium]|nr:methylenetetrahydrofolate reductase [Clostridia bacterium]
MTIFDIITADKPSLSFEVFPPKTSAGMENVRAATQEIAALKPSYMSITYGAGGGTSAYTADIAAGLQQLGVPTMAHLTCVSSTKAQVRAQLDLLRAKGIRNILALRGDIPQGMTIDHPEYRYASELTAEIRDYGGFCIGGACYPEGHPDSATSAEDILGLKRKVEAGCQFLTTQMFFDNNILYNFMYRIREAGISVPVVAGIMPVTNPKQIKRICAISGNTLPSRFIRIVDRYSNNPAALRQAAVVYAAEQIIDLYANGINAVHVYSMNKPEVAREIQAMVSEIIR